MAFDKCKDGAWQEPEDHVSRYDKNNGYWVDCEASKRYKDGAWSEVWANVKWLSLLSNDIKTGSCYLENEGMGITLYKLMGYQNNQMYGTLGGGGEMILYLDGVYENPTISFDWVGGTQWKLDPSSTTWYGVSAGRVRFYGREIDGTVLKLGAVTTMGETQSGTYVSDGKGTFTGTFEGTFNRVGIAIEPSAFSGTYFNASLQIKLSNLRINGRKVGFPESAEYDYQEWPW